VIHFSIENFHQMEKTSSYEFEPELGWHTNTFHEAWIDTRRWVREDLQGHVPLDTLTFQCDDFPFYGQIVTCAKPTSTNPNDYVIEVEDAACLDGWRRQAHARFDPEACALCPSPSARRYLRPFFFIRFVLLTRRWEARRTIFGGTLQSWKRGRCYPVLPIALVGLLERHGAPAWAMEEARLLPPSQPVFILRDSYALPLAVSERWAALQRPVRIPSLLKIVLRWLDLHGSFMHRKWSGFRGLANASMDADTIRILLDTVYQCRDDGGEVETPLALSYSPSPARALADFSSVTSPDPDLLTPLSFPGSRRLYKR